MSELLRVLGMVNAPQEQVDTEWEEDKPLTPEDYRRGMRDKVFSTPKVEKRKKPAIKSNDTMGENLLDFLGEFAAAGNRNIVEGADFLGPDTINAGLSLAGSDKRVPTLMDTLEPYGIRGGFMDEGPAREITRAAGALTTAAGSLQSVPRQADKVGSVVADILGAGSSSVTTPVSQAATYAQDLYQQAKPQNPFKAGARRRVEIPLKRRTGTADTFGYQLDQSGKVVADPRQAKAARQGVSEKVVTMLRDAPKKARERMRSMLDIVERSGIDALYEAGNRPGDVVGESLTNRTRVLRDAADTAGANLEAVSSGLKGAQVDAQPAVQTFIDDIQGMGVQFNPRTGELRFEGSDIEGLAGPQNIVGRIVKRLYNSGAAPDAYDVHRMKKFIDEQVAYGKSAEGLTGKAVNIMKSLRHNLDSILDQNFPDYNRVNTQYSETINALSMLQDAAGKRVDITGKNAETALGTLSRRILGNPVSRQQLEGAIDSVDDVARRVLTDDWAGRSVIPYESGPGMRQTLSSGLTADDLDDSIKAQIRFVSELEGIFGTNAKNSFFGEIDKAATKAGEAAAVGNKPGALVAGAKAARDMALGVNEENAMKALRELLRD